MGQRKYVITSISPLHTVTTKLVNKRTHFCSRPFLSQTPCCSPQILRGAELELKKLTNKLKQFQDDRSHAEGAVSRMITKYPWIKEDRQFFGRPQTDYDFEARDPSAAQARLKALQEEQVSLSKKVWKRETVTVHSPLLHPYIINADLR